MKSNPYRYRKSLVTMVALLLILTVGTAQAQEPEIDGDYFDMQFLDQKEEGYYTVKCEENEDVILRTARIIHVGDEYIDQDNRHFRVVSIEDDIAWARLIEDSVALTPSAEKAFAVAPGGPEEIEPAQAEELLIGVFHSHGAEAYVPSDGEDFIEEGGGILQVGERFAESLDDEGAAVIHRTETHVPHDAGAYHRSRRTKEEMLKENPTVLFDVHRDAVPEEEYLEEVAGEERVQILFVVGRQNHNMASNREFAESLKQATDEEYPGLIKGIMMAEGNYNQDMSPRSLLLEIGGHENQREDAEESAEMFAGVVVDQVAGLEGAPAAGREDTILGTGGMEARIILWLLAGVIAVSAVYLAIATGSWEEFKNKIQHFFQREFADVTGGRPDTDDDREGSDQDDDGNHP